MQRAQRAQRQANTQIQQFGLACREMNAPSSEKADCHTSRIGAVFSKPWWGCSHMLMSTTALLQTSISQ